MAVVSADSKGAGLGYAMWEKKRMKDARDSHDTAEKVYVRQHMKPGDKPKITHKRGPLYNRQQSSGLEMTPGMS